MTTTSRTGDTQSGDTFAALPALCQDLAQGAVRTLTDLLKRLPDEPLRCCFAGNWTTNKTHFVEFTSFIDINLLLYASQVRQKAKAIDADYVMTVLDTTGPLPRAVSISIETHNGSYVCLFPVLREQAGSPALTLGPARFEQRKRLVGPFSRLIPKRR
jgi:hypothetical protein